MDSRLAVRVDGFVRVATNLIVTLVIALASALPSNARAQGSDVVQLIAQPGTRLWVEGGSTVRDWRCDATRPVVVVTSATVTSTTTLAEMNAKARRAELTVPVAALDCRNATMNEHMRKALKVNAAPTIQYQITRWDVSSSSATEGTVKLSGTLLMAGQSRDLLVEARVRREADGRWRVVGSTPLRMSDWGIKPPSLMMGTMKVKDPVTIRFELILGPADGQVR